MLPRRPTAGIIFGRGTLVRLRDYLRSRGVRCPADVSLICKTFEGDPLDAASVQADAYYLGQRAVDQLLERASGQRSIATVTAIRSFVHRGPSVRSITT